MPKANVELNIEKSVDGVWKTISNLEALGSCLPFIDKTEKLNTERSRWFVKSPMRSITKTKFLDTKVNYKIPKKRSAS